MKHEYEKEHVTCKGFQNRIQRCKVDEKWTAIMEESIHDNSCTKNEGTCIQT